ncbi:hypothetical protein SLEP1_g58200 [Rubroshorea leprosula]|uniref:Zinc finger PHD-type domain-containing protein n=1 Tax=Rubroshorea leprosula TaxID=152421 RepID=A0AAV5MRU7_9ROSI|nr:hypothetical protein SLEP1_g58200 [Rubroshorea leprosula]
MVMADYGSYKCLHSDCNYVLHGSCVKKVKGRLYIEVESENEESDNEASSSSSCAVALGDKIDHFSHEHELVLDKEEIIMNGDKKCCDGCALPILEATYSCPQPECNFSLHKACAQIGEDKPHWASRDPLRVSMKYDFICKFYVVRSLSSLPMKHMQRIPSTMMQIMRDNVVAAVRKWVIMVVTTYKCMLADEEENCKFALDFRCLTRPLTAQHRFHHHLTAQHRFHHHPLKLTYQDPREADGDPSQHICEICEDRRDPKHLFYRCDKCDFDVHPDCVLGEFPFIKRGSLSENFRCDSHKQPLLYFQSEEYPYPKCVGCGHPCEDQLALKCPHSECNLTLHLNLDCYNSRAKKTKGTHNVFKNGEGKVFVFNSGMSYRPTRLHKL